MLFFIIENVLETVKKVVLNWVQGEKIYGK